MPVVEHWLEQGTGYIIYRYKRHQQHQALVYIYIVILRAYICVCVCVCVGNGHQFVICQLWNTGWNKNELNYDRHLNHQAKIDICR